MYRGVNRPLRNILPAHGYVVKEPTANNPFPCPRSWSLASEFLNSMSKTGGVEYSMLQPIVEGCVGTVAASSFAQTYAYMNRLPDIESIFKGTLEAKNVDLKGEVSVEYLTSFAAINFAAMTLDEAKNKGLQCRMPKTASDNKTEAWHLLAGMHRLIQFVNDACSPELSSMVIKNISDRIRILPHSFTQAFFNDIDVKSGLTREKTFKRTVINVADNRNDVKAAF